MSGIPVCIQCKNYDPVMFCCLRPQQRFDVVMGERGVRYHLDSWEERHISWLDRLRRIDKCGPAGVYFEPI